MMMNEYIFSEFLDHILDELIDYKLDDFNYKILFLFLRSKKRLLRIDNTEDELITSTTHKFQRIPDNTFESIIYNVKYYKVELIPLYFTEPTNFLYDDFITKLFFESRNEQFLKFIKKYKTLHIFCKIKITDRAGKEIKPIEKLRLNDEQLINLFVENQTENKKSKKNKKSKNKKGKKQITENEKGIKQETLTDIIEKLTDTENLTDNESLRDKDSELSEVDVIPLFGQEIPKDELTYNFFNEFEISFNYKKDIHKHEQEYIKRLITNLYEENDNFKILLKKYNRIWVIIGIHTDINIRNSLHFNIVLLSETEKSNTFHCYISNNKISRITEIIDLI